ncbi:malate synthase A [Oleiagrimonas soli]|uniref:malate synthase n=1 Tax=Oleiagrimonas soli TaxID=1543381 RepID=A0A099CZS9_9GAMM|nr:malate synthase A [Oleiagrimonas soli]KGI79077.1 malate synthase [Oleiagrimonas soli]MBB6184715.1 malate synthase [Oleiagrimonas soli]
MSVLQEYVPERGTIEINGPMTPERAAILTDDALDFLARLHHRFDARCLELLACRRERQRRYDAGELPDFRDDTRAIRDGDWTVAPIPKALRDRRVEITGPVSRKMVINALNSGARVFMADFEDSNAPTFANVVDGQINLRDAVDGSIAFSQPDGREYRLVDDPAVLIVRPRGWHLPESHLTLDGLPLSAALVDFGLFAWHNARALHERDRGPYFYLPKLEAMEEAALWDEVMAFTEQELGLPPGCMKATVLIETLPAAFQMDEILHALRNRAVGLNCGRWDYIFSYIKTCRADRSRVLPERGQVGMTVPFLRAYSQLLIRTCHRRGAFAMGGMAAQIPIKNDPTANEAALEKVRADKLREVRDGHDGTWVAHPALVPVAMDIFDAHMTGPNQLDRPLDDLDIGREQLLAPCGGSITREGFDNNVEVALRYTAAWLDGLGCVPIHHLMEDAATAEIARAQLWQWLHHGGLEFTDHAPITMALFDRALASHAHRLRDSDVPGAARIDEAARLLTELTRADTLADFLTLPAYTRL